MADPVVPKDVACRLDRESAETGGAVSGHPLPAVPGSAEKRTLDLLWDWPWIMPSHLRGLLGVEARAVSKILAALERQRLLVRVQADSRRRLTLSDRGLALLARRDRTSVGAARSAQSAQAVERGTGRRCGFG